MPFSRTLEGHGSTSRDEMQLEQLATKAGTDVEQLVKDTILRMIEKETVVPRSAPELPVWDLGTIGSLHRSDLYDDVR